MIEYKHEREMTNKRNIYNVYSAFYIILLAMSISNDKNTNYNTIYMYACDPWLRFLCLQFAMFVGLFVFVFCCCLLHGASHDGAKVQSLSFGHLCEFEWSFIKKKSKNMFIYSLESNLEFQIGRPRSASNGDRSGAERWSSVNFSSIANFNKSISKAK